MYIIDCHYKIILWYLNFVNCFHSGSPTLLEEKNSTCNAAYIDIEDKKLWGIPCSENDRCDVFCLGNGLFSCFPGKIRLSILLEESRV